MKPVLHSFAYCLDFLREQVADIAAPDMVVQPNGIMNHPAWIIGHLTNTCQKLGGAIGLPEWLPIDWAKRFDTEVFRSPMPACMRQKAMLWQSSVMPNLESPKRSLSWMILTWMSHFPMNRIVSYFQRFAMR